VLCTIASFNSVGQPLCYPNGRICIHKKMHRHPDSIAATSCMPRRMQDVAFALIPLIPPASLLSQRLFSWWSRGGESKKVLVVSMVRPDLWSIENQLLAYVSLAIIGYVCTDRLIPNIKVRKTCNYSEFLFCLNANV
jgi:hypothetical protein